MLYLLTKSPDQTPWIYKTKGKAKYSFNCRANSPQANFHSEASDWDLLRTVHKVMKKMELEVKKYHKSGSQPQEKVHPKRAKRGTDTNAALRK